MAPLSECNFDDHCNCNQPSLLAKEWKSVVPPLLGIRFSFDVVERMQLKHSYALISEKAPLFAIVSG